MPETVDHFTQKTASQGAGQTYSMRNTLQFREVCIAPMTPFFHGTRNAPDVILTGVRPSRATPGGSQLRGLRWFFASHSPALAYCICDFEIETPAVIEYRAAKQLRLADIRDPGLLDKLSLSESEDISTQIENVGYDGVVIPNTTGCHDYEYGIFDLENLTYFDFKIPHTSWRIAHWGWDKYCMLSDNELSRFHESLDRSAGGIAQRIEQRLGADV